MKEEIIGQIDKVLKNISAQATASNTVGLLESANRLAGLRYNLGDLWVNAKSKAEKLESDYKYKVDSMVLDLRKEKKSIEEAKALARKEFVMDYDAFLDADNEKNRLAQLRDDLALRISLLQSYCSELRAQKHGIDF